MSCQTDAIRRLHSLRNLWVRSTSAIAISQQLPRLRASLSLLLRTALLLEVEAALCDVFGVGRLWRAE